MKLLAAGAHPDIKLLLPAAVYGSGAVAKLLLKEIPEHDDEDLEKWMPDRLAQLFRLAAAKGSKEVLWVYIDYPETGQGAVRRAIVSWAISAVTHGRAAILEYVLRRGLMDEGDIAEGLSDPAYSTLAGQSKPPTAPPYADTLKVLLDDGRFSGLIMPLALATYASNAEDTLELVESGEDPSRVVTSYPPQGPKDPPS